MEGETERVGGKEREREIKKKQHKHQNKNSNHGDFIFHFQCRAGLNVAIEKQKCQPA